MTYDLLRYGARLAQQLDDAGLPVGQWGASHGFDGFTFSWGRRGDVYVDVYPDGAVVTSTGAAFRVGDALPDELVRVIRATATDADA